jgi:zinc transporter ZupT
MNILFLATLILLLPIGLGGLIVVLLERSNQKKLIKLSLAFGGGFLLAIAFTHLLPELYGHNHASNIGFWVLLGFLIQLFLEYFSGGIEHGHIHAHGDKKIPYLLLLSLSVHSFIEGMPLAGLNDLDGLFADSSLSTLLIGITLHQLPVSIALMTLMRQSPVKLSTAWLILFAFGIMVPLGMYFAVYIPVDHHNSFMSILLAIVVGMLLHISTTIIFETSENHRFNFAKLIAILLGVSLSFGLV